MEGAGNPEMDKIRRGGMKASQLPAPKHNIAPPPWLCH